MDKEKNKLEKEVVSNISQSPELIEALNSLIDMENLFGDFIAAETEGMIICENCLDTAFDDDENICTVEDKEGKIHVFCSKECMEEWKNRG